MKLTREKVLKTLPNNLYSSILLLIMYLAMIFVYYISSDDSPSDKIFVIIIISFFLLIPIGGIYTYLKIKYSKEITEIMYLRNKNGNKSVYVNTKGKGFYFSSDNKREKAYYKVTRIYHYIVEVGEEIIPTVDEETNFRIYEKKYMLKELESKKNDYFEKKETTEEKINRESGIIGSIFMIAVGLFFLLKGRGPLAPIANISFSIPCIIIGTLVLQKELQKK